MKSSPLRGQVLLITVLILSIGVTIALSLIGRGVTDVTMSRSLEESAKAFSAAEAGIEKSLQTLAFASGTLSSGVSYSTNVATISGTSVYTPPPISIGEVQTVWLVDHDTNYAINESIYYGKNNINPTIDFCWQHAAPAPALEVAIYYKSPGLSGTYFVQRQAFDPDLSRRPANKFSEVPDINDASGKCVKLTNAYHQPVTLLSDGSIPMVMRIRPYYNSAIVTVSPTGSNELPKQGWEITSTGSTQDGITRKIVVRKQYPSASSLFDYSLYSQSVLEHY